jgi:glycosyltransferase involved in cell wall biosynthesis
MMGEAKITFFIGPFGSGGGERNCCNLANAFTARGIEVTVVAIGVKDRQFLKRFDSRVRFVDLGKKHLRQALPRIIKYILDEKPIRILAFNHYLGTGLELLRMIPQFNYSLYMRNIVGLTQKYQTYDSFWQKHVSNLFVKIMLRQVDKIISQCQAMKIDLRDYWFIQDDKIEVIYNPVASDIENKLQPYSRNEKEDELLFVGRFSPEKGVGILIDTFASLRKKHPNLTLRLLGEGPLEPILKKHVDNFGISYLVIFQVFVSDPDPF